MKIYIQTSFEQIFEELLVKVDLQSKKINYESYIQTVLMDIKEDLIRVKKPKSNVDKALDGLILTLEAYYQLPIYFGDSSWQDYSNNDFFYSTYEDNITEETEARLHFLIYTSLLNDEKVDAICNFADRIPHGIDVSIDILAIPSIAYKSVQYNAQSIKKNIDKIINQKSSNHILNLYFIDTFDEDKMPLKWDSNKLSRKCSDLLIYLCNSVGNDSDVDLRIKTFGVQRFEVDKFSIINNWSLTIFKNLCAEALGDEKEQKKIDNGKVNELFHRILTVEKMGLERINSIPDDNVQEFLDKWKDKLKESIISSIVDTGLTNAERDLLLSYFQNVTNRDLLQLEDFDIERFDLFDNLYMPFIDETVDGGNPYSQIKEVILQIKDLKEEMKKRQKNIDDIRDHIDENYHRDGIWTNDGYRIGNDVFKINKTDLIGNEDRADELLSEYQPDLSHPLPHNADLKSYFPPIKNQGKQGACASFSLTSVFEYFLSNETHQYNDMSEAFVYYNARALSGTMDEDDGADLHNVIRGMVDKGVCIEELCKYDPDIFDQEPSPEAYEDGKRRRVISAKKVPISVDVIKSAINEGFPVVGCFRIFKSLQKNTSGYIPLPTEEERQNDDGFHAMVICGYNDAHGHFIVRNSWGTGFGDNGYCYLPYSYVRDNDLTRYAVAITGIDAEEFIKHCPIVDDFEFSDQDNNIRYAILLNLLKEDEHKLDEDRKKMKKLVNQLNRLIKKIKDRNDLANLQDNVNRNIADKDRQIHQLISQKEAVSIWDNKIIHIIYGCILVASLATLGIGIYKAKQQVWISGIIVAIIDVALWMLTAFLSKRKHLQRFEILIQENDNEKKRLTDSINEKMRFRDRVIQILDAVGDIDETSRFNRELLNIIISTLNDCYQQISNYLKKVYPSVDEDTDVIFKDWYQEIISSVDIPFLRRLFTNSKNKNIGILLKDIQKEILKTLDANFNKSVRVFYPNTLEWNQYVHSIIDAKVYARFVEDINPELVNETSVFLSDLYMPNIQVRSNYINLNKNRYIYIIIKDIPKTALDIKI